MIYYYSIFGLFAIILTMMVLDANVSDYIVLVSNIIKIRFQRMIWMIRFHPIIFSSPIGKWWMMRKYMRTVEELSKDLGQDQK